MDAAKKLELLQSQLDAAQDLRDGKNDDLEAWRQKTATVLRMAMGDDHDHTYGFDNITYRSKVSTSAHQAMRQKGLGEAVALLKAAIFEVEIEVEEEALPGATFDTELWNKIDYLVQGEKWDQVVSSAVIFFEHWTGTRSGLSTALVSDKLMSAAYRPGGPLELGTAGRTRPRARAGCCWPRD